MRAAVAAYVEFVRNVPLLLLVYLVVSTESPARAASPTTRRRASSSPSPAYAGAYLVEVFRAGLDAVPRGLVDAGMAIGLTRWQRLLHVRLPTMFRVVLPSLSNAFISLFKDTSLASVIAVPELTYGAQWIKTNSFRVIEVWVVVTPMYLATGYALLYALRRVERRFAVGR